MEDLASVELLSVVNVELLRSSDAGPPPPDPTLAMLDERISDEESGFGDLFHQTSGVNGLPPELVIRKGDFDGLTGVTNLWLFGWDLRATDWTQHLFEFMTPLEDINISNSAMGVLPNETFERLNGGDGVCPPSTIRGRCVITALAFRPGILKGLPMLELTADNAALFHPLDSLFLLRLSGALDMGDERPPQSIPDAVFSDMDELGTLHLASNGLTELPVAAFGRLPLRLLSAHTNRLGEFDDAIIDELPLLRGLHLAGNAVDEDSVLARA